MDVKKLFSKEIKLVRKFPVQFDYDKKKENINKKMNGIINLSNNTGFEYMSIHDFFYKKGVDESPYGWKSKYSFSIRDDDSEN